MRPGEIRTVEQWSRVWMDLYPGRRNADTARHNAEMVAPFVRAHGRRLLNTYSRLDAQSWAIRHPGHVRYLRLMFAKAERAGLVPENVWDYVEAPVTVEPRVPPTPAELEALTAAARARGGWWRGFGGMIVFTAYTGGRLQEVAGVQAKDILESGRRVVLRGKRRPGEQQPRERIVGVFGPAVDVALHGPQVGLLWRSKEGRPLNRSSVGRAFQELRADVGYAGTWHCLRHYCASWLLDNGASRMDVAVQLGHMDGAGRVDETQVRETYGHVDTGRAVARLESAVESGESHHVERESLGDA